MAELVDALDSKSNGRNAVRVRVSLCPPIQMNFNNFENLLDLFFLKYQSQEKRDIFLQSLSDKKNSFSWEETFLSIKKFSELIKKNSSKGQRCLLISENVLNKNVCKNTKFFAFYQPISIKNSGRYAKKIIYETKSFFKIHKLLVGKERLELSQYYYHWILSPTRLPVPPFAHKNIY